MKEEAISIFKCSATFLLATFFSMVICSPAALSQNVTIKTVGTDSTAIEYATVFLRSKNITYITNDAGELELDSAQLFSTDTLIFTHISYQTDSLNTQELKTDSNGVYIIWLEPKVQKINEVVIKSKKIQYYKELIRNFEKSKSDIPLIFKGILTYMETQNGKPLFSLVSDIVAMQGSNQKDYFSNHSLEWDIPHLTFAILGSYYYIDSTYSSPDSYNELDKWFKFKELKWTELFTYGRGPMSSRYSKYYEYKLDSTTGEENLKKYYLSFSSIRKTKSKHITIGKGQVVANNKLQPILIVYHNPLYPIRYPSNRIHFARNMKEYNEVDSIGFINNDTLSVPAYISYTATFPNGRKVSASLSFYSFTQNNIPKKSEYNTIQVLDYLNGPEYNLYLLPFDKESTRTSKKIIEFQNAYNINYTWVSKPLTISKEENKSHSEKFIELSQKYRNLLWEIFQNPEYWRSFSLQ
ncbi:peptidase associated/transthyretin-like domain-containing protein [Tenuifilum thalassicum]|uniref:Carboxypeptidase-like regulatory domain-containing protein n=1 Tax=Tenuifilum thalassicum TaxID=2590900 RepID=A0A7D4C7R6_9BACT|nr:hypothetical protein [Tenuifilum thalassicum]QKG79182.1 carboxypeptidase-like regulatory domain-containing protein [Tenuifilum thalassicum]